MKDVLSKPLLDTTVVAEHVLWWVCLSHIYTARCTHTHTHIAQPLCEALYACTLAIDTTNDSKWIQWLCKVHKYIYEHLCDVKGGGEWFGYLRPDGSVFNRTKGGNYKGCFHVPRALLFSIQCAKRYLKRQQSHSYRGDKHAEQN